MKKGFQIIIKFQISASINPFWNVSPIVWVAIAGEHIMGNQGIFLCSLARHCHTPALFRWHLGSEKGEKFSVRLIKPCFFSTDLPNPPVSYLRITNLIVITLDQCRELPGACAVIMNDTLLLVKPLLFVVSFSWADFRLFLHISSPPCAFGRFDGRTWEQPRSAEPKCRSQCLISNSVLVWPEMIFWCSWVATWVRTRCPGTQLLVGPSLDHQAMAAVAHPGWSWVIWVISCLQWGVLGRSWLQVFGAKCGLPPVQLRWSLLLHFTFWKWALPLSHPDMSNGSDTLSHPGEGLWKMSAALLNLYFQVQINTRAVNAKLKDKPQSCPKYQAK